MSSKRKQTVESPTKPTTQKQNSPKRTNINMAPPPGLTTDQKLDHIIAKLGKLDEIEAKMSPIIERLDTLEISALTQDNRLSVIERELDIKYIQENRLNIVLLGVKTDDCQTYDEVKARTQQILDKISVDVNKRVIPLQTKIIGTFAPGKNHNIKITVANKEQKNEIFKNSKNLKGSTVSLRDDLPLRVRVQKTQLRRARFELLKNPENRTAKIHKNSILVNETQWYDLNANGTVEARK